MARSTWPRLAMTATATLVATLALTGTATAQPLPPPPPAPIPPIPPPPPPLDELFGETEEILERLLPPRVIGPGVKHREFVTTEEAGAVRGDIITVDLGRSNVRAGLLSAGAVSARAPTAQMANSQDAVAAINGDFFDIGVTNAPAGPVVAHGQPRKAAVPAAHRLAPAVPGATPKSVVGVGRNGRARIGELDLSGQVRTPEGTLRLEGLNQYAIPTDGVGLFTHIWGAASRAEATCGTNTDPSAGCAEVTREVVVRNGRVVATRPAPGSGRIPRGTQVLVGRGNGARALAGLQIGDRVRISYRLVPEAGGRFRFAIGGSPILRAGTPVPRLSDVQRAPRSAAGVSRDGRTLYLVTVDGRQSDSIGATLAEFAKLLDELHLYGAVNLDGGGSSTLAFRRPGQQDVTIVNDPSAGSPRAVPNGIGVFVG